MAAPERLNVLITRARHGMILFGNMQTFVCSKKGRAAWLPFFDMLKARGCLYDGLPVRCERHPERTALLKVPSDFAQMCPDGGCPERWYVCHSQAIHHTLTSSPVPSCSPAEFTVAHFDAIAWLITRMRNATISSRLLAIVIIRPGYHATSEAPGAMNVCGGTKKQRSESAGT